MTLLNAPVSVLQISVLQISVRKAVYYTVLPLLSLVIAVMTLFTPALAQTGGGPAGMPPRFVMSCNATRGIVDPKDRGLTDLGDSRYVYDDRIHLTRSGPNGGSNQPGETLYTASKKYNLKEIIVEAKLEVMIGAKDELLWSCVSAASTPRGSRLVTSATRCEDSRSSPDPLASIQLISERTRQKKTIEYVVNCSGAPFGESD